MQVQRRESRLIIYHILNTMSLVMLLPSTEYQKSPHPPDPLHMAVFYVCAVVRARPFFNLVKCLHPDDFF